MNSSAELRARKWLAEQLAWEQRLEELRAAAGLEGLDVVKAAVVDAKRDAA